jgi:hypothetical protein
MKKFTAWVIACLFAVTGLSAQDYIKKHIWEMAGTADLIITGKISAVKGNDISLQIADVVTGDKPEGDFSYAAFRTLKSAKRWGKYVVGEEVLLFLQKDGDKFKIMGDAGEGEKLIMNGKIYLDSRGEAVFNKFTYFPLPGGKTSIYAEELDLAEFKEAVKLYPNCFSVGHEPRQDKMGAMYEGAFAEPKCDDKEQTRYRLVNLIADKLTDESLKAVK